MISIEHENKLTIVGVFGEFTVTDYRQFEQEVGAQLKAQGRLNLLIDLTGMLEYTLDVALEDIRFAREHAKDVGRIAIISNQDLVAWLALWIRMWWLGRNRPAETPRAGDRSGDVIDAEYTVVSRRDEE